MTDTKIQLQEIATKACEFDQAHFDDDTAPTVEALLSNHLRLPADRKLITRLRPRYAVALGFFEGYVRAKEDVIQAVPPYRIAEPVTHRDIAIKAANHVRTHDNDVSQGTLVEFVFNSVNAGCRYQSGAHVERPKMIALAYANGWSDATDDAAEVRRSDRHEIEVLRIENDARNKNVDGLTKLVNDKTAEWMTAQTALDAEKEAHRKTMSELGLAKGNIAANQLIVLDELRTLQNRIALQPSIVNRDTIVVWVEKTIARLASDEPKNTGIVKNPPTTPHPAAPADELSTEIDDDLAKAAAEYSNNVNRMSPLWDDPERIAIVLDRPRDSMSTWGKSAVDFVAGVRWQLTQIENSRAGDDPTMYHPSIPTNVITDETTWARAKVLAKLKLEWVREAVVKMKRLMSEVHDGKVMTIEFHETMRLIDKAIDEQVGVEPNAIGAEHRWMRLHALRDGAVFETTDGIRAIKSQYRPYDAIECTRLSNGSRVSFGGLPEAHNNVLVREIVIPDRQAPPGTLGVVRTVLVDLAERMGDHSLNVEMTQEHLIGKIIEFVDYLREYQPIAPKAEPMSSKDAPAQADDVQAGSRGMSLEEAVQRYARGPYPTIAEISTAWFGHAGNVCVDAASRVLALFEWKRSSEPNVEPRRDYLLAPTPMVFRDDNEREYWDEMTFMLARKGDTTAQSVTGAADEMVEERRARIPNEAAQVTDELLLKAAAYANNRTEFKADQNDLAHARSAYVGNFALTLQWSNAVRSYVAGALGK
jgi:hypothetical protein